MPRFMNLQIAADGSQCFFLHQRNRSCQIHTHAHTQRHTPQSQKVKSDLNSMFASICYLLCHIYNSKFILTLTNFIKAHSYDHDKSHHFCICEKILYSGSPLHIDTINKSQGTLQKNRKQT